MEVAVEVGEAGRKAPLAPVCGGQAGAMHEHGAHIPRAGTEDGVPAGRGLDFKALQRQERGIQALQTLGRRLIQRKPFPFS